MKCSSDTYRRKKKPARDSKAATIDAPQTDRDFRLQIEENLAASRWRSRSVTKTKKHRQGWGCWGPTNASTVGYNSRVASIYSDLDSLSTSDSEDLASPVVEHYSQPASEDEEVPAEETRQDAEQSEQDGHRQQKGENSPSAIENFPVDNLDGEGDEAPASTAGAVR
jgi:hypothetical protein